MEKVSIIIPTYNRAGLIEKSIQSVLAQTYPEFELLIVDDGSVDDTQQVVQNIGDDRIRYIKMPENRGVAAARNEGIRQSAYDYIAFQDSDDLWKPEKLAKQMKMLSQKPQAGLIYCAYECKKSDGTIATVPNGSIPMEEKQGSIYPFLLGRNTIGMPSVLARKECLMKSGLFHENLSCLEDWELFLRIAKNYEIAFLEETLVYVHMWEGGVSSNVSGYFEARCYMLQQHKAAFLQYNIFNEVVQDILIMAQNAGVLEQVGRMVEHYLQ